MSIQVKNIEKHFGAFHALKNISWISQMVSWLPCSAHQVVVKRLYCVLLLVWNLLTVVR